MAARLNLMIAVGLTCMCLAARADDAPAASTDDVASLIPQLDDGEFSQRQAASQKLMAAGKAVFPQLEKAALEGSREASGRAIDILKTHFTRGDDETKQAAKASLERLAGSGSAGAAQRASEVINPPKEPELPFNGRFGGPILRGANLQIQVGNLNGNRRSSTKRDANGRVEVELEENGKKTRIVKNPNGGMEAETTEKQNGQDVTKKVEAKDLDELKKKDPDAAKIFEQYGGNGNRLGNIQIQGGFAPGLPGAPNVPGAPNLPADLRERMIKSYDQHIELLKPLAANNSGAQRQIEILQQRKKDLEQQALPAPAPAEKPAEAAPPAEKAPTDKANDK